MDERIWRRELSERSDGDMPVSYISPGDLLPGDDDSGGEEGISSIGDGDRSTDRSTNKGAFIF